MCLGIPGEILEIMPNERHPNFAQGRIRFGDVVKQACLAYVPEAGIGDFVIVHAGFAITIIDAAEAGRVWRYLEEMDALDELAEDTADDAARISGKSS